MNRLRLRKVADLVLGLTGPRIPAWYEVLGLPKGQQVLIEFTGTAHNRWRINKIGSLYLDNPYLSDPPTFETPEAALNAFQREMA